MNVWSHFIILPINLSFIANFLSYNHPPTSRFLNLNTIATLSWIILCGCSTHYWEAHLASTYYIAVEAPTYPIIITTANVSRHCHMSLGGKTGLSKEPLLSVKGPNEVIKRAWWAPEPAPKCGLNITSYLCGIRQVIDHAEPQHPCMHCCYPAGVLERLNEIQPGTWWIFNFHFLPSCSLRPSKGIDTFHYYFNLSPTPMLQRSP